MASSTSGTGSADTTRYQSYLNQLEREQDAEVHEKEDDHKEKLTRLVDTNTSQEAQIHKDYNVKISDEAETMQNKLNLTRERNDIIIAQERERGEKESDRIRSQYQQKIEMERKTGDEQLSRMQEYYKKSAEEIHRQYAKAEARETQKGKLV